MGNPSMPPTQLARAGSTLIFAGFRYQRILERINARHTDVLSAANSVPEIAV